MYDFHARMYDPALGRFGSVDPQGQFANPYLGMGNNPVVGVDPDGEFLFVPILIGAAIGGVINLGIKAAQGKINSPWDAVAAFGIGAIAGGVGAATGGMAFLAAGGGAAGAGGFLAGFAAGAFGSVFSMPIQSLGNTLYFGDPLLTADQFIQGILIGGLIGGGIQGGIALKNGREFWNGTLKPGPVNNNISISKINVTKPPESKNNLPLSKPEQLPDQRYVGGEVLGADDVRLGGDLAGRGLSNRAPHIESGLLTEKSAMSVADKWLGAGYKEISSGRFVSADGMRQVRFGFHEVKNINNIHIHFEAFNSSYWNGGRVIESTSTSILMY
jgi:hypothetical protein